MSAQLTVTICAALAGVGIVVDSLELLTERRRLAVSFPWPVLQTHYGSLVRTGRLAGPTAAVLDGAGLTALLVLRLLLVISAVPLLASEAHLAAIACLLVSLLGAGIRARLVFGLDGSDQMQAIIWIALTVYAVAPGATTAQLAIVFVGLQVTLSYLAAGVAKAVSSEWRSGTAIPGILSTESYGQPRLLNLVDGPLRSKAMCWSVIAFEVGFPLLALLGGWSLAVAVGMAVAFHLGVAFAMGLNGFLWAFPAALPCALYTFQMHEFPI